MSIAEGTCDWCGQGRLLETGDERSQAMGDKLWCGTCREGSRYRYHYYSSDMLQGQIEISEEMLKQHPIAWESPYDHIRMHLFKLGVSDEVWRMKRELEFRNGEVTEIPE